MKILGIDISFRILLWNQAFFGEMRILLFRVCIYCIRYE